MKTMTLEEMEKRGLKQGDLYYMEHEGKGFTGWYLVLDEYTAISLNAKYVKSYRAPEIYKSHYRVKKVIMKEDLLKNYAGDTAEFFKTFDETLVEEVITNVVYGKIAKYISAVHFGSTNTYTWRVPERLQEIEFKIGDIVKVDTRYGGQYVEVREVMEDEYDKNYKEVLAIIKKC